MHARVPLSLARWWLLALCLCGDRESVGVSCVNDDGECAQSSCVGLWVGGGGVSARVCLSFGGGVSAHTHPHTAARVSRRARPTAPIPPAQLGVGLCELQADRQRFPFPFLCARNRDTERGARGKRASAARSGSGSAYMQRVCRDARVCRSVSVSKDGVPSSCRAKRPARPRTFVKHTSAVYAPRVPCTCAAAGRDCRQHLCQHRVVSRAPTLTASGANGRLLWHI